jgi:hypothetical protein
MSSEEVLRTRQAVQAYKSSRTRIIVETTIASFLGSIIGASGFNLLSSSLLSQSSRPIGISYLRATPIAWISASGALIGSAAAAIIFARQSYLDEALDSTYLTSVGLTDEECNKLRGLR